jgi:hypothetical protein
MIVTAAVFTDYMTHALSFASCCLRHSITLVAFQGKRCFEVQGTCAGNNPTPRE